MSLGLEQPGGNSSYPPLPAISILITSHRKKQQQPRRAGVASPPWQRCTGAAVTGECPAEPPSIARGGLLPRCPPPYKGFPFLFFLLFLYTKTEKPELSPPAFLPIFSLFFFPFVNIIHKSLQNSREITLAGYRIQSTLAEASQPHRDTNQEMHHHHHFCFFCPKSPPFPSASLQPTAASKRQGSGKVLGLWLII